MPERYRLTILLASWCGLRFGEITELRRHDFDLTNGVVRIRRAVVRVDGEVIIGTPKSDAGMRDVSIPPHLLPVVKAHLGDNITGGRDGLLFPAAGDPTKHLAPATLYRGSSTRRAKPQADPISGSTTFATPEQFWPPAPAPPWPN